MLHLYQDEHPISFVAMPKRTLFTNITPLPPQVSREVAIAMLHNHDEMIELNPLVIEHHPIKTPRDAPADEFLDCVWQELTDKIHYLPGGIVKGKVSYKACFHDTPTGLQTHIYAPMGLDIREKWSIGGSLPGEPPEHRELGLNTPRTGLYIREDGDMRCNILLSSFVRKNLDNAHKVLVERILKKAERVEEHLKSTSPTTSGTNVSTTGAPGFQRGSHMAQSQFVMSPRSDTFGSPLASPARSQFGDMAVHPAFRDGQPAESSQYASAYTPPPYQQINAPLVSPMHNGFPQDVKHNPYLQQLQHPNANHEHPSQPTYGSSSSSSQRLESSQPQEQQPYFPGPPNTKEFIAELPGSSPEHHLAVDRRAYRESTISEMSNSDTIQAYRRGSDRGSIESEPSQLSNPHPPYNPQAYAQRVHNSRSDQPVELPTPPLKQSGFQQR